jgi:hypothetical protein
MMTTTMTIRVGPKGSQSLMDAIVIWLDQSRQVFSHVTSWVKGQGGLTEQ